MTDLEKCENAPEEFVIDMSKWVEQNSHCKVCFAGSVMVQEFGIRDMPSRNIFTITEWRRFRALDLIRKGLLYDAVYQMHGTNGFYYEMTCRYDEFPNYHENKKEWKETMYSIIGILQAEGY